METKKNKTTKKEYFAMLLEIEEVKENAELVAFIKKELELLNKKSNSVSEKRSKRQEENEAYKEIIYKYMESEPNRLFTISEIIKFKELPDDDFSAQRASALLTQLVNDRKIERTYDKKKSYYQYKA